MTRLAVALAVLLVAGGTAWAQTPSPAPASREQALTDLSREDVEARRRAAAALGEVGRMEDVPALVQALRDRDGIVRALAENSLWGVWSHSGDPEVDALFELGVEQMNLRQGPSAVDIFTRIVEKKPEFAEGWNKRATVYFLMGEYDKSLRDCDEVMKRNPSHFGALAGYGQIYLRLGRPERALPYFERALAVNPNMDGVAQMIEEIKALLAEKRRESV
ncbi:MAG TPA: tetratricopeptide repeat protein [Verrucomicrobiae bacterium]|nr:tetratricopeptide repeat protein [Verrucomicrobiae bacterium]